MKHRRLLPFVLIVLLIVPAGHARGNGDESPLLRLLSLIPDMPAYRAYVGFGDIDAWYTSWDVPRVTNWGELEALDEQQAAYWHYILARQLAPPDALGLRYLQDSPAQIATYGFDMFGLDRFIVAGSPPDEITVTEFSFDGGQIMYCLGNAGYEYQELDEGGVLYSVPPEEQSLTFRENVPPVGQFGALDFITVLDGQMIITREAEPMTWALAVRRGEWLSLADDAAYVAAARALTDPALDHTGELVAAILTDGALFEQEPGTGLLQIQPDSADEEMIEELRERYGLNDVEQLFEYKALALGVRHADGASYLIAAGVLPAGTDAETIAALLADRMQSYTSMTTRQPLSDYWTFDQAAGIEVDGLPVALVVVRADDPPPPTGDQEPPGIGIIGWYELYVRQDIMFLSAWGVPPE
ncbi:MAG: hypothetical protein JXJ20_08910 [Anaerolineae bacterium]|nr:hypothetical protein [Anaerolineae bacterium]